MAIRDLTVTPLFDLLDDLNASAECRFDPELHTGPDAFEDEAPMDRAARVAAAKEVCESCPVWDSCLEYALRIRPKHGIYAGYTPGELSALAKSARDLVSMPELGEVA